MGGGGGGGKERTEEDEYSWHIRVEALQRYVHIRIVRYEQVN